MRFLTSKLSLSITLLVIIISPEISNAVEIVRFNINYFNSDTTPMVENHVLDVELFDDATPLTVNNFINYINNGKYNGSFFNRSVQNFIIQAGGFTFRPTLPDDSLQPVDAEGSLLKTVPLESSSPVKNEYDLTTVTNVRGTLAMAKIPFNPDSATSEWFINLADNRENLDNQNGGFTVFGKIIDNGISIADTIVLLPTHPSAVNVLGAAFSALPVTGYTFGDPILEENLALISSANSSIIRPVLRSSPAENIFPLDIVDGAATGSLQVITLMNTGNETLTVSTIANTSSAEFVIESDNCTSVLLEPVSIIPNASCNIDIRFTATVTGEATGSIDVNYMSSSDSYTVSLTLIAEGVTNVANLTIDDLDLASTPDVFFGFIDDSDSETRDLTLRNKGGTDLTINTISLSNNTEFNFDNNSCTAGTTLSFDESCTLIVSFNNTSTTVITYDTTLAITSTANNLDVELSGIGLNAETSVPASVDFGSLLIDQTETKPLTVTNTGNGLILDNFVLIGTDADQFSFVTNCPDNGRLPNNISCVIFVTFAPTSAGDKTASLAINSNDSASPVTVLIIGTGIEPVVPILSSSETSLIFANTDIDAGIPFDLNLTIENIGNGTITISSITIDNDSDSVFSFDSADCKTGSTLDSCVLTVSFLPDTSTTFTGNLIVQTDFGNLDIPLSGIGTKPVITASTQDLFLGTSQLNGLVAVQQFKIVNEGTSNLLISDISITGENGDDFTRKLLCTAAANQINLAPFFECAIEITLDGQSVGSKTAAVVLTTNDSENPTLTINLTGNTAKDVDGIPDDIERQAPNNGDGNNDNIADDTQNNVASFIVGPDIAITMVSDDATLLLNTGLFSTTEPATALLDITKLDTIPTQFPDNVDFNLGVYSYTVQVIEDVSGVGVIQQIFINVAMFFPLDVEVDKFYRFGPVPFSAEPQLYDFTFDNTTGLGARLIGPVTIESPTGKTTTRNLVIINYADGGLGDDDLDRDGVITISAGGFSSAPPATKKNSSGSGAMSIYYLLMFIGLIRLVRIKRYYLVLTKSFETTFINNA